MEICARGALEWPRQREHPIRVGDLCRRGGLACGDWRFCGRGRGGLGDGRPAVWGTGDRRRFGVARRAAWRLEAATEGAATRTGRFPPASRIVTLKGLADRGDIDFTYSLTDKVVRLSLGRAG